MKGYGEAHPFLSAEGELADFETWGKDQFGPAPKTGEMLPRGYAREALKRGLGFDAALGSNPFKLGMVGLADTHTSLYATAEDNFFGKVSAVEPTADPIRFEKIVGVNEIPTPRRTAYDRFKVELELPPAILLKSQQRSRIRRQH
jgi:hypothetical protein